jgi:hypothetical protein
MDDTVVPAKDKTIQTSERTLGWLATANAVRQGRNVSPTLYKAVMDEI